MIDNQQEITNRVEQFFGRGVERDGDYYMDEDELEWEDKDLYEYIVGHMND